MAALAAATLAALGGCSACPPSWVDEPPVRSGYLHAAGHCGDVYVEADETSIALARAARRLCDELDLDVNEWLSVVLADGRLYVEAVGPDGPLHDLDDLELVDLRECGGQTFVLVRLPVGG